jgi:hypothetical protein
MSEVHTFEEFRDRGLLWLINTSVFHPRGYAIAFVYEDDDTEFKNPTGWQLIGDGSEPWWFIDDNGSIDLHFAMVEKLFKENND